MTEQLSRTETISRDDFPEVFRETVRELYELVFDKTPEIKKTVEDLLSTSDEELKIVHSRHRSVTRWGLKREVARHFQGLIQKDLGPLE